MTMLRAAALAALLLMPATGFATQAQTVQTPQGAAGQSAVEQRIQSLKLQLAITPQQEALWDAFAQKMRENAAATERLAQQRSAAIASLNALDNMRSYARISHEYAANADRLTAAFEGLYASLTPVQKQTADTLFRQEAAAGAGAPTR